jgi:hypothetical protein
MLQNVIAAFRRSTPDVDVDRGTLVQKMYGINGIPGDPFDLFAPLNPLGPGLGMDWNFDDLGTDPLDKESKKLKNKLLQRQIETERARAELIQANKRKAVASAAEASAKAETARSFLPSWKQPK